MKAKKEECWKYERKIKKRLSIEQDCVIIERGKLGVVCMEKSDEDSSFG